MRKTIMRAGTFAAAVLVGLAMTGWTSTSAAADEAGKAPATAPTTTASPLKFYGTITAVDTKAKTFTIDDQTYAIVPETEMTKAADGSTATMTDVVVGETARGTYTKSDDGTMKVTKVRFGRKTGGSNGGGGGGGKKKKAEASTKPASD